MKFHAQKKAHMISPVINGVMNKYNKILTHLQLLDKRGNINQAIL